MANTTSKNQVVFSHDDGWAVCKEGSNRATAVFETRDEAMERARELADNQDGDVYYMYTGKRYPKDRSDSDENTTENN